MEAINIGEVSYSFGGDYQLDMVKSQSDATRLIAWSKETRFYDSHTDKAIRNRKLCLVVQRGDARALEDMVVENEALVASVVKKILIEKYNSDLNCILLTEEDLMQEGRIILVEAARKYDLTKFTSFTTFAQVLLERGLRKYSNNALDLYENKLARQGISTTYLDQELENSDDKISDLCPEQDSEYGRDFIDYPIEYSDRYGNLAVLGIEVKALAKALLKLEPREFMVIDFIYGLTSREPHSLKEATKYFCQTKERIEEIELKAIWKLRKMMEG